MLHKAIGVVALAVALFWGVVWLIYATWLGVMWIVGWLIVLTLDYGLYRETAPATPVVEVELVE